jgi:hypothetical protein
MAFLTDLATNATSHNMSIIIYSANDDALLPHRGSEGGSPIVFIVTWLMRSYSHHPGAISEITLSDHGAHSFNFIEYDIRWYPGLHPEARDAMVQ